MRTASAAIATTTAITALLLGTLSLSVHAQTTPRLDKREVRQEQRIEQGVKSGRITPAEAARLEKRGDRLEKHEAKAKADGVVTPTERARLEREANRNSRAIARQAHDRQGAKK